MEKQINPKSTKNEILQAYDELLGKIQESKADNPKEVAEKENKKAIVLDASSNSHDSIVKNMTELKAKIGGTFDEIESKLIAESKKFEQISEAISIESQNLDDIYGIKANADSLAALLLAQKERKETFENEMQEKKASAEKEVFEKTTAAKEDADKLKIERKREEEEYNYNLKLSRKKDQDIYEEKKLKLEKDLTEKKSNFEKDLIDKKSSFESEMKTREDYISGRETELESLRESVEKFPKELENSVKEATTKLRKELEQQFDYESKIATKDTEAELKLKDQEIGNLKARIADQVKLVAELTKKADGAATQVQSIAVKAIESSSKPQVFLRDKETSEN